MEFLCIDILNSNRVDWQDAKQKHDLLEDAAWMTALAKKWNLPVSGEIDTASLHQMKALRQQMYTVLNRRVKMLQPLHEDLNAINATLESISIYERLEFKEENFEIVQIPDESDWPLFVYQVAMSFAEMLSHYENTRIKICENDNCGWVFFDNSKNKSRRWCDNSACGNIMKVRAFRARKKAEVQDEN